MPWVNAIVPDQTCEKLSPPLADSWPQVSMDSLWYHRNIPPHSVLSSELELDNCMIVFVYVSNVFVFRHKVPYATTFGQTHLYTQLRQCSSTCHGCIQRAGLTQLGQIKSQSGRAWDSVVEKSWSQALHKAGFPLQQTWQVTFKPWSRDTLSCRLNYPFVRVTTSLKSLPDLAVKSFLEKL